MATDIQLTLTLDASQTLREMKRVRRSATDLAKGGMEKVDKASSKVKRGLDRTRRSSKDLGNAFKNLRRITQTVRAAVIGFGAALIASHISRFVKSIAGAQTVMDKMRGSFIAATGDQAAAMAAMDRATETAKNLGVGIEQSALQMARLAAAGVNAGLEMSQMETVFKSVSKASVAVGLSAQETSLSLLAVEQMASKGKISAEELRRQLGERIPGAFGLAAKAMGVTTAEFDKMLRSGKVMAEDFLPKFAKVLDENFTKAWEDAQSTLRVAITGMQNQMFELRAEMAERLEPGFKRVVAAASELIEKIRSGPAFDSFVRAMQDMADAFAQWLSSADAENIINDIVRGLTALLDLVTAIIKPFSDSSSSAEYFAGRLARIGVVATAVIVTGFGPWLVDIASKMGLAGGSMTIFIGAALALNAVIVDGTRVMQGEIESIVRKGEVYQRAQIAASGLRDAIEKANDVTATSSKEHKLAAKEVLEHASAQHELAVKLAESAVEMKSAEIEKNLRAIGVAARELEDRERIGFWENLSRAMRGKSYDVLKKDLRELNGNSSLLDAELENLIFNLERLQAGSGDAAKAQERLNDIIDDGDFEGQSDAVRSMSEKLELLGRNIELISDGMDPIAAAEYAKALSDGASSAEAMARSGLAVEIEAQSEALSRAVKIFRAVQKIRNERTGGLQNLETEKSHWREIEPIIISAADKAGMFNRELREMNEESSRGHLQSMFRSGQISAEQMVDAIERGPEAVEALIGAVERYNESTARNIAMWNDFTGRFANEVADAFAEFAKTGEFSWKGLIKSLYNMLIDFLADWLAQWIAKILARDQADVASYAAAAGKKKAIDGASNASSAGNYAKTATNGLSYGTTTVAFNSGLAVAAGWAVVVAAIAGIIVGGANILKSRSEHAKKEVFGAAVTVTETASGLETIAHTQSEAATQVADAYREMFSTIEEMANFTITGLPKITISESNKDSFMAELEGGWRTFGSSAADVAMAAMAEGIKRSNLTGATAAVRDVLRAIPQMGSPEAIEAWFKRLEAAVQLDRIIMSDTERVMDDFQRKLSEVARMAEEAGVSMETTGQAMAATWEDERQRILENLGYGQDRNAMLLGERDAYNAYLASRRAQLDEQLAIARAELEAIKQEMIARADLLNVTLDFNKGLGQVVSSTDKFLNRLMDRAARMEDTIRGFEAEISGLGDPITEGIKRGGSGKKTRTGSSPRDTLATMFESFAQMAGQGQTEVQKILDHYSEMQKHVAKMKLSEEERASITQRMADLLSEAIESSSLNLMDRIARFTGDEALANGVAQQRYEIEKAILQAEIETFLAMADLAPSIRENLEQARGILDGAIFGGGGGGGDTSTNAADARKAWDDWVENLKHGGERMQDEWTDFFRATEEAAMAGLISTGQIQENWLRFANQAQLQALDLVDSALRFAGIVDGTEDSARLRWGIERTMLLAQLTAMKATITQLQDVFGEMEDLLVLIDDAYEAVFNAEFTWDPHEDIPQIVTTIEDQTDRLEDALSGLRDLMQDLLLGNQSILSPEQKMSHAISRYQSLVSAARTGDVDAINELQSFIPEFLRLAESFYGGTATTDYTEIFRRIFSDLSAITGDPNPLTTIGSGNAQGGLPQTFRDMQEIAQQQRDAIHSSATAQRGAQYEEMRLTRIAIEEIRDNTSSSQGMGVMPPAGGGGIGV